MFVDNLRTCLKAYGFLKRPLTSYNDEVLNKFINMSLHMYISIKLYYISMINMKLEVATLRIILDGATTTTPLGVVEVCASVANHQNLAKTLWTPKSLDITVAIIPYRKEI